MLGGLAAAHAHVVQMLLLKGDAAGLDAVRLFLQLVLDLHQTFQKNRVEDAAFAMQNHVHGLLMRISLLIYTLAYQRIVYIRQ